MVEIRGHFTSVPPNQILGQVNGAAQSIWYIVITKIVNLLKEAGHIISRKTAPQSLNLITYLTPKLGDTVKLSQK